MENRNLHIIHVRVVTRAKTTRIERVSSCENSMPTYKIYVNTPPIDGKANAHVQKILAKFLDVPSSSVALKQGFTSRDKIFHIYADDIQRLSASDGQFILPLK